MGTGSEATSLRLDHVMYVVRDLDEAARRVRFELGLDSYAGGEHVGIGTANRVVPLGDEQYVELMAVTDETTARSNPVGQTVLDWAGEGEGLRAWCLSTTGIDAVAARLGLNATAWTRLRPDGVELHWRLAGVDRSMADASLPFFIQWDVPPSLHPGAERVDHTVEPLGIAWIEVGGDPERIAAWTERADLPVRVVPRRPGPLALGIATPDGEVVLR